jgi:hypothetical protein
MHRLVKNMLFVFLCSLPFPLLAQENKLTRHAKSAPAELHTNLPALVEYLIEPADTERNKAYVLYSWLIQYLEYDYDASRMDRRLNRNLGGILRRKKGVCFDYAVLFERMCQLAGLTCYRVDGYADPQLSPRLLTDAPNHSWNAVQLDHEWYLLDPTWGNVQDELSRQYQTTYFLTPPEVFILNHLPANPAWQLLPCPVTPAVFSKGPAGINTYLRQKPCKVEVPFSLSHFLSLLPEEQALLSAKAASQAHPTKDNQKYYAQALTDWAVFLSKRADSLLVQDQMTAFVQQQEKALASLEQAFALSSLHDWQIAFYAELQINLAVAISRLPGEQADIARARDLLQSALQLLTTLPEDNYYRSYAEQQCVDYLEILERY